MDRQGTIFAHNPVTKKTKREGLDGDSGVGQAPESPFKPFDFARYRLVSGFAQGKPSFIILARVWLTNLLNTKTSQKNKKSGSVKISPISTQSKWLAGLGTVLIVFSVLGFTLTYGPILKTELQYQVRQLLNKNSPAKGSFGDILAQALTADIDQIPDPNFSLIIPKIGAASRVIPNVDPGNEAEYMAALKQGVAHAKGTYLPGGEGTVYLFAHSTNSPINIVRYNAVFYLLRELAPGDEVIVYFAGVKHRYQVTDKKIVEPTDVSYLLPQNPLNKELLILQTCWPPGTRFKRLLIFAEKIEVSTETLPAGV